MKKLALAFALTTTTTTAQAEPGEVFQLLHAPAPRVSATQASYFPGIGSRHRSWEVRLDTAFGTNRVFTQRVEVARAWSITNLIKIIVRVNFGLTDDTRTSLYLLQGPLPSLGVRLISQNGNFWIEGGLRALIPYPSPNDRDPRSLILARDATLNSAIADDAAWLPFSRFALQGYFMVNTRFCALQGKDAGRCAFFVGGHYGGEISPEATVTSWLGPQTGYIGNAFAEVFAMFPELSNFGGLQIGGHADVSLSAIWPGTEPFPASLNVFVGWSPVDWLSARVFIGKAAPLTLFDKTDWMPFGIRALFYLP